jgi:hypothetical protein
MLSVAIYSLFALRFLGYGQSELSAVFSAGAAMTIATQIFIVPGLVKSDGIAESDDRAQDPCQSHPLFVARLS